MKFKLPFEPKLPVRVDFMLPSRTHQSFMDECDINNIMARFQKTGLIEHVKSTQGQYGDFMDVNDYQTALNAVMDANDSFASLPSSVRARFNNSPANFLDFVNNDDNYEEAKSMGLLRPDLYNNSTTETSSQESENAS